MQALVNKGFRLSAQKGGLPFKLYHPANPTSSIAPATSSPPFPPLSAPADADRKVNQTLQLNANVLDAYRHEGQDWQSRINHVLGEHMPLGSSK